MRVYFMSTPKAIGDLKPSFKKIYDQIEKLGHKNLTDFLVSENNGDFYSSDIVEFSKKNSNDLKKADICIFETSIPSLAIGQLIGTAIQYYKPVIALYKGNNPPLFLKSISSDRVQVVNYDDQNIDFIVKDSLEFAVKSVDIRFNFFVSPSILNYLDWIAKNKKTPRSVYLRSLIESEMEKNEDYKRSAI